MNTSGLFQSYHEALRASLTLHETRSIHDSMNLPKIEFISYVNWSTIEIAYLTTNRNDFISTKQLAQGELL